MCLGASALLACEPLKFLFTTRENVARGLIDSSQKEIRFRDRRQQICSAAHLLGGFRELSIRVERCAQSFYHALRIRVSRRASGQNFDGRKTRAMQEQFRSPCEIIFFARIELNRRFVFAFGRDGIAALFFFVTKKAMRFGVSVRDT